MSDEFFLFSFLFCSDFRISSQQSAQNKKTTDNEHGIFSFGMN